MHTQITKKVIETIPVPDSRELLLRDTELRGFAVRISLTGAKTFFAEGNFKRSRQTKRLADYRLLLVQFLSKSWEEDTSNLAML